MRLSCVPIALLLPAALCAEVHTLTLRQAVELAIRQSPDVVMARLDEQKAQLSVRIAKDPFLPKMYSGSGLAYTSGYPNSIEGSAPSIVQIRTDMALFNRQKSYELAQARETARGFAFQSQSKTGDVAFRTASVFLDAGQSARSVDLARHEVDSLQRVKDAVAARVGEGRELALDIRRADLDLGRARQRVESLLADQEYAEGSLAMVLGFPAGDLVRALADDDTLSSTLEKAQPDSEESAVESALRNSSDLKSIESQMAAKGLEARAQKASRLPQFDIVAQYALFAKRNYQDFFPKVQRNNGQLGVSIRFPILNGSAPGALAAQADIEATRLREQFHLERNRISLETRRGFQDVKKAETARSLAKLDLEVAREQLSILLAQLDEGRVTTQQVEQARFTEQEKWIAFYGSQSELERARLSLLRQTGTLLATLR